MYDAFSSTHYSGYGSWSICSSNMLIILSFSAVHFIQCWTDGLLCWRITYNTESHYEFQYWTDIGIGIEITAATALVTFVMYSLSFSARASWYKCDGAKIGLTDLWAWADDPDQSTASKPLISTIMHCGMKIWHLPAIGVS